MIECECEQEGLSGVDMAIENPLLGLISALAMLGLVCIQVLMWSELRAARALLKAVSAKLQQEPGHATEGLCTKTQV